MANREPDRSAAERLTAATRRVVDLVRRTQASGETAEQALAALERAAALLEPHAHPGPWAQRSLAWDGALAPIGAPRDLTAFFPYSPLIGPRNPLAPPAELSVRDGRVHGRVRFGAAYTGPPTSVHGGVIAALFDELLGCANLANEVGGMTGTLRIRYRAPTPIGEELRLEGWVERIEGRKITARGTMHHGDTLTAEADGVFIQGSMQRFAERLSAAARPEVE
jgi:acyl-coenzyme A thioesterase PaaI-like protein